MVNAGFLAAAMTVTPPTPGQDAGVPASERPEEIVVYGRAKATLRHELHRTEERVFAIFNSLNSDDEFDIHCKYRAAANSLLIKERVCEANFVGIATGAEAQAAIMGRPSIPAFAVINRKRRLLLEEMKTLAVEHPELLDALEDLGDVRDRMKSLHAKRRSGD